MIFLKCGEPASKKFFLDFPSQNVSYFKCDGKILLKMHLLRT